jgi:hypothetical protein
MGSKSKDFLASAGVLMGIYVDKRKFKNGTVQFRFTFIDKDE